MQTPIQEIGGGLRFCMANELQRMWGPWSVDGALGGRALGMSSACASASSQRSDPTMQSDLSLFLILTFQALSGLKATRSLTCLFDHHSSAHVCLLPAPQHSGNGIYCGLRDLALSLGSGPRPILLAKRCACFFPRSHSSLHNGCVTGAQ